MISSNFLRALSVLLASICLRLGSVALLRVEISRVRKKWARAGDSSLRTLVNVCILSILILAVLK